MKMHRLALAVIAGSMTMVAHAGEVTFSPMVGYHMFDSEAFGPSFGQPNAANSDAKDRREGSVALGYRVNPNVGIEGRYGFTNMNSQDLTNKFNYRATTLDTYYRFNPNGTFQPYVLVGGGYSDVKVKTAEMSTNQTIANAAIGAFVKLTDNLALRGELRDVYDIHERQHDGIASVGLTLGFGASKAAAAAPVALAPVVKPAPVAAPADDDKDGVVNSLDKCPNTPANVVVDASGCPKVLTETVTKELHVLFDTNKTVVKPGYNADIEAVANLLKEYPTAKVEIQGHTDSRGAAGYNEKLSQGRANAVAAVLEKKYGIAADRITAKGYGAAQPVADNKTAEGRAKNRRVMAVAQGEVKVTVKK